MGFYIIYEKNKLFVTLKFLILSFLKNYYNKNNLLNKNQRKIYKIVN